MNKIITQKVMYRGQLISVDQLKENSNIKVKVECPHGYRWVKWCRRHQMCRKCAAEAGIYNTSSKGRDITWGDKISKAKKGKKLSEEHKEALLKKRIEKSCQKRGIKVEDFDGFATSGHQLKLRNFIMSALRHNIIKYSIDQQNQMIHDALQYSIKDLHNHLESQFQEGMSWDNYGEWQIDHIKPDSWFTYKSATDVEFKECWSLNNLQPMWAWQNLDKMNKYQGNYKPRKFYMLAGQFGVGKTTIANNLNDKFTVISYDKINIKDLDKIIRNNYYNEKPILLDIPTNISTVYNRYCDKYDIHLVLIVESPDVVIERITARGGTSNENAIISRFNRMLSIRSNYSNYSGTAEEVYDYLRNLKL